MTGSHNGTETQELLDRLNDGDNGAFARLIELHRTYLRKLLDLRMEDELRTRIDLSDVVQETHLAVSQQMDDYLQRRPASFRVWLRSTALERLADLRRRHLAKRRSVRREVHLSDASSLAIARKFLGDRPSQALRRKELAEQVRAAIMSLGRLDREVLLLRHVEELSNAETAVILEIREDAARKRLGRALRRLTQALSELGVCLDD